MKQREFFTHLLDRVVEISVAFERERKMRLEAETRLAQSASPQIDPRHVHDLIKFMATDRKIEAIKAHRALTGCGLKDSKDAVETVMNRFA